MRVHGMDSLYICDGTIKTEIHTQVLGKTYTAVQFSLYYFQLHLCCVVFAFLQIIPLFLELGLYLYFPTDCM